MSLSKRYRQNVSKTNLPWLPHEWRFLRFNWATESVGKVVRYPGG